MSDNLKFSLKPFSKGLQGSRGQNPSSHSAECEIFKKSTRPSVLFLK